MTAAFTAMLCNACKQNEAKVHLTKIVGDKIQKVDLCEDCSKDKGVDDPTSYSDLLLGLSEIINPHAEMHDAVVGLNAESGNLSVFR